LGLSATAATPSPFPFAPWHPTQLSLATSSPRAIALWSFANGFLRGFSAAGATQGV